ncbi:hypothetical protein B0T18DRAFT_98250 [Schizothecium vesticola]|uniref:Uncharacterized protein n=1 Tax=Schizothecium vesticola TaxID=314040 RepID=A0AA40F0U9_9PEZI|nr:hypothetical protein B0T18DRAFT_98250 [Schizothecium vesticola]
MPSLTYVSEEILLMVAGYLGKFPLLQHRSALWALYLTSNRRLPNFLKPILYKLCLRDDQFCPMKWAAWNGKVGPMRRAAANQVDIDRVDGWTPQFQADTRRVLADWYYPVGPRALELAVIQGRNACIGWLLRHEANMLQPVPKVGQTARQYAAGLLTVGNEGCARSRRCRVPSQTGCSTKSLKKVLARL